MANDEKNEGKTQDPLVIAQTQLKLAREAYAKAFARHNNTWRPRFFEHNQSHVPRYFRGLDAEQIKDVQFQSIKRAYDDSRHTYLTLVADRSASDREAAEKGEKWNVYLGRFSKLDKAVAVVGAGFVAVTVAFPAAVVGIGTYRLAAGIGASAVVELLWNPIFGKDTTQTKEVKKKLELKWTEAKKRGQTYEQFKEENKKAIDRVGWNVFADTALKRAAVAVTGLGIFTAPGIRAGALDVVAKAGNEYIGNKWGSFFVFGHDLIPQFMRETASFAMAGLGAVLPVLGSVWHELFGVRGARAGEVVHYGQKVEAVDSLWDIIRTAKRPGLGGTFLVLEEDGTYTAVVIQGPENNLYIAGTGITSTTYAYMNEYVVISAAEYQKFLPFYDRWWASFKYFLMKNYGFYQRENNRINNTVESVLFTMQSGSIGNILPHEYYSRVLERANTLPSIAVEYEGQTIETAVFVGDNGSGKSGLDYEGLQRLQFLLVDVTGDEVEGANADGEAGWGADRKGPGGTSRAIMKMNLTHKSGGASLDKIERLAHELGHVIAAILDGPENNLGGMGNLEALFNKLPLEERAIILAEMDAMHSELLNLQEQAMADGSWDRMSDEERLKIATGYNREQLLKTSNKIQEVLGDCIGKYLTHPDYVNAKSPHFAKFLKELVNNHPKLRRALVLP